MHLSWRTARGGVTRQHHYLCNEQSISYVYWHLSSRYHHTCIESYIHMHLGWQGDERKLLSREHFALSFALFREQVARFCLSCQAALLHPSSSFFARHPRFPGLIRCRHHSIFRSWDYSYLCAHVHACKMYVSIHTCLSCHPCTPLFAHLNSCAWLGVNACHEVTCVHVHKDMRFMHLCIHMCCTHIYAHTCVAHICMHTHASKASMRATPKVFVAVPLCHYL